MNVGNVAIRPREVSVVNQDIDAVLRDWDYEPGGVQARLVRADDGRQVVQMRLELGVLQMEVSGRPDGQRPHGQPTYFDYLRRRARRAVKAGRPFTLDPKQCEQADREFVQFYHRRVCWLALREYGRALNDAEHTLAFMDLVRAHAPSEDYVEAHEQYRGFVVFQRTQAAAALRVEEDRPEQAVDEVRAGLERLRAFFSERGLEEEMGEDGMVLHLRRVEAALREQYQIGTTLQEQLEQAVAREDYERAAELRDALKRRD